MPPLKWTDADEIGFLLHEAHRDAAPLSVPFERLRELVLALEGFADDPGGSSEPALEAIQMAWLAHSRDDE